MAELNDSADLFANSSNETVKENLDYSDFVEAARRPFTFRSSEDSQFDSFNGHVFTSSPMSPKTKLFHNPDLSFLANQFVSEACNVPVTLYCPFCSFTCHFEFIFKDHIKNIHPSEIMSIIKSDSFYVEFHACPFCHAKFYVKDLLPKHILSKHEDSVVFTGLGRNDYAQCRFCSFKLLQKHLKRLIMHIEKKHMAEFEKFIKHQNTSVTLSSKDMKFLYDDIIETNIEEGANIEKLFKQGSGKKVKKIKSILKPAKEQSESHTSDLCARFCTPNNGSYEAIRIQNSARRKLRFELPESVEEDKENRNKCDIPCKTKKNKVKWFSLFKKEKQQRQFGSPIFKPQSTPPKNPCEKTTSFFTKFHLEHDGVSPLTTHHFKCGLCREEFENNAQLLSHLHLSHRGLSLTAQYRCGACNAKFYRNSYLVRHCWFHHTPLCLKKKTETDEMA